MRVLFVVNPEKSIFQYLVPLAWALRTAGHEVRVASQPAFATVITQAGLTAVPVGEDRDPWRITANRPDLREAMRVGIMKPYDAFEEPEKATWEYLRPGLAEAVRGWHRVANFPIIAELVEFARHWRPDLVVWEPLTFAGGIAARACGAAHARLLFGVDVYGGVRALFRRLDARRPAGERADPMAEWLTGYARKYGFDFGEDMVTGHFTIDQLPRSLQVEADLPYVRMRHVPYGGPSVVPDWLRAAPERPRVGFTMGLHATEIYNGYNVDVQDILDHLGELDIEVVATIAASERPKLRRIPPNARVVPFVPWQALVSTCAAVVHHAGAATLATAALHPIPQLSLHYHFDQPTLARKLAAHGAGLELHTGEATGPAVAHAVHRLLTEPAFARRAHDLRDEVHASPSPNDLVPHLEELTAKHR
ncbi:activator-dependent family glycosyltransferase [Herbidospora yilanensis]|uniref:activator-dependent family glycosyltransferase n=1 Tax=Herbidospora yilanensis TaxID=354426 RepID=UPI0007829F18|nr:activator-dependent family glycosyltransferase [Herbidospora yilanensis]